jgi:hypothetical protein
MLDEKKIQKLNMIHKEIDSGSYVSYGRVYSDKFSSDINNIVDCVLANYKKSQKAVSRSWRRVPWKQIISVALVLFMFLAAIPYVLPPLYGDFGTDISIVLDPGEVYLNDTLFINITIPSSYNIISMSANMASVESIDLLLIDNSTSLHLWQGVWFVHGIIPDEHIMTITAMDEFNMSYSAGVRLSILPEVISGNNESGKNETVPSDIDTVNKTTNETTISVGLNLLLQSNKDAYVFNDTVSIQGIVTYNDSLINTSVDLFAIGPDYNLSNRLNVVDGSFVYEFITDATGIYILNATVSYSNENISRELVFDIKNISIKNISKVSIVDAKKIENVYVIPGTSFYVERTISGINDTKAIFAPLFSDSLTLERIEIINNKSVEGNNNIKDTLKSNNYKLGKGISKNEKKLDKIREKLNNKMEKLDTATLSDLIVLKEPIKLRIWFKAPSWDQILSDNKVASGRISYIVFSDGSDDFDFEGSTWWNANWLSRKLLTVNSSQVNGTLVNFPILVNITDSDLANDAQDDGDDIAFVLYSDNATKLNHEIEWFNGTSGELVAWVNVTSLSSSADTKIWMYYSNEASSNQQNPSSVWDSNYIGVWHFNETSGTCYDSTGNNNYGTNYNSNQNVTGKIDGANQFDGTNDWIQINDSSSLEGMQKLTVEAWIYDTSNDANARGIVSKRVDSSSERSFSLFLYTTRYINFDIGTDRDASSWSLTANQWCYLVATFDGSLSSARKKFYFNGSYDSSAECTPSSVPSTTSNLHIGILNANYGNCWAGKIDEIRISNNIRNSSWMITSYNTMTNTSTFIIISSEEQVVPLISNPVPTNGSTGISIPPSCFNITINDPNGDNMNITWYTNASGSWVTFNTTGDASGVGNGTYSATNTSWITSHSTKYWWSVNVSNSIVWSNVTYSFTTSYQPVINDPIPNNGSTYMITPICSVKISDVDGGYVTVRFYENTTGSWILQQTNSSVIVSAPATIVWNNYSNASVYDTKYWWKINVSDGTGCFVEAIYWFNTTTNNPPIVSSEYPTDLSSGISKSLSIINVTISDPEGNAMDWSIQTSPNIGNNSGNGAGNGSISCSVSGLSAGTTYYWYVNVTDGILWTIEVYRFTTSIAPTIELIAPSPNGTTNIGIQPTCKIWANDTDGNLLNITWATNSSGSWVNVYTNISISANSTVSYLFSEFDNYSRIYYWKVFVNDSSTNTSEWFYFTTTGISTSIDTINPYIQGSSPLVINATGSPGLSNVSLWYRYTTDNSTWWNSSWSKRKPIYLNVTSTPTQRNYQVLLNITYNNDMKNDFSDLRFVNYSNGSKELDYWIENKSDGNWALVWVEIDDNITTINQTLAWIYYGNPDATSISNGSNTFVLFDDFIGSSYDDSIWGTNAVEGAEYNISNGLLRMWGGWNAGGGNYYFASENSFNSPIIVQARANISSITSDMDLSFGFQNSQTTEWWTNSNCVWCLYDSNGGGSANCKEIKTNGVEDTGSEVTSTDWQTHIIKYTTSGVNYYDSNLGWLNTTRSTYSPFYFSLAGDTDSSSAVYVDYVFLRNYSFEDPIYTIGSENSWIEWGNSTNPDINYPWSWNFNFPNGNGYYEFYSIGKKTGIANETIPNNADAKCYFELIDTTIDIVPSSWEMGNVTIGTSNQTTGFYFNLTNLGSVPVNIQIKGSNATNTTTGSIWRLNTTADFDNFSLQYNLSGGGSWTNINLSYDAFITSLVVGSWKTFDLKLILATLSSKSDLLSVTITFRSVAS